jgi:2-methylcitrate dehydratase PrpD
MGLTKDICDLIYSIRQEEIPPEATAAANRALIESLGLMLVGSRSNTASILLKYVNALRESPQSTVIGGGFKTSVASAALVNGTMAQTTESEPDLPSEGDATAVLVPTVLSVGEWAGVSGTEILTAYVLGLEVGSRICTALLPKHDETGWHATGTVGIIRATVSSARLLKLNSDQLRYALGIATSLCSGVRRNCGTMTKFYHGGNAARNGILAAILAKEGFSSDPDIVEARYGLLAIFGGDAKSRAEPLESMSEKLFETSRRAGTGVSKREVEERFVHDATPVLDPGSIRRCLDFLWDLKNLENIAPLMAEVRLKNRN